MRFSHGGRVTLVALLAVAFAAVAALPAGANPRGTTGQITFARFNPTLGDTQIYVVNPDASGQRLVQAPTDTAECPRWSPDGTRIATCGGPSGVGDSSRIFNPDDGSDRSSPNSAGRRDVVAVGCPTASRIERQLTNAACTMVATSKK